MLNRNRLALVMVVAVLIASRTSGQSGALVGIFQRGDAAGDQLRPAELKTLWITQAAGGGSFLEIPALLVPRVDGWWRVGITHSCANYCDAGWSESDDLWARKGIQPPPRSGEQHSCTSFYKPKGFHRNADMRSAESTLNMTFLSSDWVSIRVDEWEHEPCEIRGGRSSRTVFVASLDHPQDHVEFGSLTGPEGDRAYDQAIETEKSRVQSDPKSREEQCPTEPFPDSSPQGDWSIARQGGVWRAYAYEDVNFLCSFEGEIKMPLPQKITGHDALAIPFAALAKTIPGIVDAFSSPGDDMLMAVLPAELQLYQLSGRTLGKRVGSYPLDAKKAAIVMIQWSTGRNVARWTTELSGIKTQLAH